MSTNNLWLFVSASFLLLAIPGPSVLYIFARSIEQGRLAGFISIIGIHAATLVHVLVAVLGLSAILASSTLAFNVIKYAGAAYLIWLGVKRILSHAPAVEAPLDPKPRKYSRLLGDGFVVNLLNPKTALFFLAFLPQFVDLNRPHVPMQIGALGLIYIILGLITDSSYALIAGIAAGWLKKNRRFLTVERQVSGVLLIGLGLTAAFAGGHGRNS
ncbi:LysE family translocator [Caulobacter soli]|uniref:LysE family translocator n=1 Tax=Caulobacter soli TaxID=2708539 RepID=UPI001FE4A7B6|nr:LysE family translocator [Caulobacter soli]